MVDRLADVEARLAAIELRLGALEGARARQPAVAGAKANGAPGEGSVSSAATYLGRVLLIFGGAYLLRAITDYGFLPTWAGIPTGAAYALLWLYVAYRAAAQPHKRTGARVYGAVSVLLVLPILVEAVTRFQLLSGPQSAVALTLLCLVYLLVVALRELRGLAWLVTAGGLLTGSVLLKASGAALSFSIFMLLLGLACLWIVYLRRWRGLQWLGAAGANFGVVSLALMSSNAHWPIEPLTPYLLGLALWGSYLLSFAVRSHLQGHPPGAFEAAQALVASAIVMVVAVYASQSGQLAPGTFGMIALGCGIGAYALAFTPATRAARGRSHYFYSSLGLALLVCGSALMFSPASAAVGWSLLAVGLAWSSGRYLRVSLSLHCSLLLIAAAAGSGVLATGLYAFAGDATKAWPAFSAAQLAAAVAMVACLFIPVAQRSDRWGPLAVIPQLAVLLLALWSVGGLIVTVLASLFANVPGPDADLGTVAALRTLVLALAAVTLALSSRYRRWPEARWLAYPVLIAVGIKLLLDDFPHGRPLTLFIALALVGGALILVSKLVPQRSA
jgi:hypothetical protein